MTSVNSSSRSCLAREKPKSLMLHMTISTHAREWESVMKANLINRASHFIIKMELNTVSLSLLPSHKCRVMIVDRRRRMVWEARIITESRATNTRMDSLWACPKFMMRPLKVSLVIKDTWTTWLLASRCVRATMVDSERSTLGDVQRNSKKSSNVYITVASPMPRMLHLTCTWERNTMRSPRQSETAKPERSFEPSVWRAILISLTSSRHSPKSNSSSYRKNCSCKQPSLVRQEPPRMEPLLMVVTPNKRSRTELSIRLLVNWM